MRKGFLSFLMLAMVFDNPEGGGGGGAVRPDTITAEEWEGLSETEREGTLMNGEGEEGTVADDGELEPEPTDEELAAIAGTEPSEADKQKAIDDAVLAAAGETTAVVAPIIPAVAQVAAAVADLPGDDVLLQFRAVVKDSELPISTEVPEALATRLTDLEDKFADAEITQKDYQTQRDAVNRDIIISQIGSRDAARADKVWEKEQAHFLDSRPDYLAKDLKGNAMFGVLGEAVKAVSNDPKFANASGMAILMEADKAVRGLFGSPAPATATAPVVPAVKPAAARPDVKTLANVPAAAAESTTGDPFAPIDRLTGEAYEKALERLSPEQRAEYERRA